MRSLCFAAVLFASIAPHAAHANGKVHVEREKEHDKAKEEEPEHERTHFFADPLHSTHSFFGGQTKPKPFFQAKPVTQHLGSTPKKAVVPAHVSAKH